MEEKKIAKLVMVDTNPGIMRCPKRMMEEAILEADERKVQEISIAMDSVSTFPVALSSLSDAGILDFISHELLNEILEEAMDDATLEHASTTANEIVLEECKGFDEYDTFKFPANAEDSCFAPETGIPSEDMVEPPVGSSCGAHLASPAGEVADHRPSAPVESFNLVFSCTLTLKKEESLPASKKNSMTKVSTLASDD